VLGQNYSNGSVLSVDMDVVVVMEAYLPVVLLCIAQSKSNFIYELCVCASVGNKVL